MERDKQMNRNRKKILQKWEKRRIRNRHERKLRKERVFAYKLAIAVLIVIAIGVVGNAILVGGAVK